MSQSKTELMKAVLAVMDEVKSIDKNLDVGSGKYKYSGVADKDVKQIIGSAMKKNGLAIFPIGIEENTETESWQDGNYRKTSVMTKVKTKYLLLHESGESIEIVGYGHGVDSQDKSAGKATTYALKNTLLYTFLVPTGQIDDTDTTHSEDIEQPKVTKLSKKDLEIVRETKTIQELTAVFNEFNKKYKNMDKSPFTTQKEYLRGMETT